MTDVIPILRSKPVIVEPGQTVEDAAWHAGWTAAIEAQRANIEAAYATGHRKGVLVGMEAGPSWTNLLIVSVFASIIGFCVALGYFG